ncbi:NAD(P)H-dependent oxidoreductase [Colwellia sp. 1_MG-2023]|uniref:flavodoxin family protein n=1 Tax=Colwellia sp. 1_MG-2023 TaxID=3062649 RepID=UPI0026E253EC|nr:NAD(P)H-dependent oxidoreductase [Colwellia sp. 1_MG-2023]MDO6446843.1 NAD(P)H-dependent oxidoreductase [Colwellia sp. 1_MG-2023]
MKLAIVLGTAKSDGNTRALVDAFTLKVEADIFDLSLFNISFFDYLAKNKDDDFLPLIHQLLTYDHIIFASPVYWYSMSAQLKVFIDRLPDLLTSHQDLGRKLKGKSISVLSTGYDLDCPDCFIMPFKLTANYLGLIFKGYEYVSIQSDKHEINFEKNVISAINQIKN